MDAGLRNMKAGKSDFMQAYTLLDVEENFKTLGDWKASGRTQGEDRERSRLGSKSLSINKIYS